MLSCEYCEIFKNIFIEHLSISGGCFCIAFWQIWQLPTGKMSFKLPLWYRIQSIGLQSKSMDWFLYDNGLH